MLLEIFLIIKGVVGGGLFGCIVFVMIMVVGFIDLMYSCLEYEVLLMLRYLLLVFFGFIIFFVCL